MAVAQLTDLFKGASVVDFTGQLADSKQFSGFGNEFTALVRQDRPPKAVVIVDQCTFLDGTAGAALVVDHLNVTGYSPLVGPNHPCGERFTVVQNIYVEPGQLDGCDLKLKPVIVAGLKGDVKPTLDEIEFLKKMDAAAYCYHLIPAMLIAAHAGCRVLGIVVSKGSRLDANVVAQIKKLVGG